MLREREICDELRIIERENGFRMLFACESGSRAWGFSSPNSDYDVRFVYMRPLSDYLRLEDVKDVYESIRLGDLDVVGWDLGKFLRLLRVSNPSAVEWLSSPDVYYEYARFYRVRELLDDCFDPLSCAYHYYGMAKKHDMRYLKQETLPVKKYLYIIRAILAVKWCITRFEPVPMRFDDLKTSTLPAELSRSVETMLASKRGTSETHMTEHNDAIDAWINDEMGHMASNLKLFTHKPKIEWQRLDDVFRSMLEL